MEKKEETFEGNRLCALNTVATAAVMMRAPAR